MRNIVVERARTLLGCRFRPQGRDPALGLDCVGLVRAAFAIEEVPRDYRLRGNALEQAERELQRFFEPVGHAAVQAGDVLLLRIAPDQLHLAIKTERGFVHADAAVRKVVETPGSPPWAMISAHRYRS